MAKATITSETKTCIKGVTSNGFEFSVDKDVMNDAEFMEILEDASDNTPSYRKIGVKLLGEEQKKKLYDHFRTKDGRVPLDAINTACLEIIEASTEGKNS